MDDRHEHRGLRGRAFRITERLHWVHAGLGMAGNVLFLVGSVLFLWDATQLLGTWLFILASLGCCSAASATSCCSAASARRSPTRGRRLSLDPLQ